MCHYNVHGFTLSSEQLLKGTFFPIHFGDLSRPRLVGSVLPQPWVLRAGSLDAPDLLPQLPVSFGVC